MHDPMTVAFDIKAPWYRTINRGKRGEWRHHPTLVTIWHVDPERDGTDDSCGWFAPKVDRLNDLKLVREMVEWEQGHPYYFAQLQRVRNPEYPSLWSIGPGDALGLVLAAWMQFAWRLERRARLSTKLINAAIDAAVREHDNFQHGLTAGNREDQERTMLFLLRAYRRARRPWWRHPRWHVHHWRIQVPIVGTLKRWLFSRCASCGKRFPWNYAPISTSWHGTGPRWFRREPHVYHQECCSGASVAKTSTAAAS
jgi:hypothetical protein